MSVSYAPSSTPKSQFADKKLNFVGVLRSEALKFRTLITNWVMTVIIALVMLGLSVLGGFLVNLIHDDMQAIQEGTQTTQSMPAEGQIPVEGQTPVEGQVSTEGQVPAESMPTDIPADQQMSTGSTGVEGFDLGNQVYTIGSMGIDLANILIASVAVVFIAAEYATRSINTTMTAVPKRSMVYFAKMLVLSVYSFAMGFVLSAIGFFLGYVLLDSGIREQYPIEGGIWLNCLAVGLYFMMLSWMGLGFGSLMRNNAGGIVLVVVCLFILPIVIGLFTLGFEWAQTLLEYVPNALGREMLAYQVADDAKFNNVEAGGLLAIWCVVPAVLGYLRIRFTDPK